MNACKRISRKSRRQISHLVGNELAGIDHRLRSWPGQGKDYLTLGKLALQSAEL